MYYLDIPSIVGKKQGNKTYYYLVECVRLGGKPRIVSQRYLGPAEEIIARLSEAGPGEPDRTRHLALRRPRRGVVGAQAPEGRHKDRSPRAEIVADYRSQSAVENDFRQMKDPKVVSFSPMFHWTDHKIRVHVSCCVLALSVARLMVPEADRHGMHMRRCCSTRGSGAVHGPGGC